MSDLRVILGSIERHGPWPVPSHLATRVVCGSLELDLRRPSFTPGVTTIDLDVTLGSVAVFVPRSLAVEVDVRSSLGSVEDHRPSAAVRNPGQPLVRIIGTVMLGSCTVIELDA